MLQVKGFLRLILLIAGWPAPRREDAIKQGLKAGISYRQLSRLTGIGKTVIERIARI